MNFSFDLNLILIVILAAAILVLAYMVVELNTKLKKFLIGTQSENLDDTITAVDKLLKELEAFKEEMGNYLATVETRVRKSVQAVYTVRFNPFKGSTDSGGNQSFATAFLDQAGSGVVISTLYAREHVRMFSKPIVKGISEYELSTEEKEALNGAMKMINK